MFIDYNNINELMRGGEGGADIFLDYFMLIIQGYVCTLPGSYNREIFLFVLCYTNQYSC